MSVTIEPNLQGALSPEKAFQDILKEEIIAILEKKKVGKQLIGYSLFEGFGLDLAVFIKRIDGYSVKFLELKAFVGQRQGGVGFGNGQGEGSQVNLLLLDNQQLTFFAQFIRWVLVDGTKERGTKRYSIFDSNTAKRSAMGGVKRGKQNNFRIRELMAKPLSWAELLEELNHFLSS